MRTRALLLSFLLLLLVTSGTTVLGAESPLYAEYVAAEKAAKEAESAIVNAKAAVQKAAAAQSDAEKAATEKRQQAEGEKKKVADLLGSQKQAEANLAAAAQAVTEATNAKAVVEKALAETRTAVTAAQEAKAAAEKAGQPTDETTAALTQAQQKVAPAEAAAAAAANKLSESEKQKKAAEEALANVKNQVAAASKTQQAAEQAAKQAEAAAATAKAAADKARAAQAGAEKAAADKRAAAGQAKAKAETDPETKARLEYDAANQAAKEAEAALAPLRTAMQNADTAYANASKVAKEKRQRATDTKNLAGERGQQDLKQAEANVPVAIKALEDATKAKPPLDAALTEAKAVALPLQEAYKQAEKEAKEAEAVAKAAAEAANKLDNDAKRATTQATAKRRQADTAKGALERAQQGEQNLLKKAEVAAQKLAEAEAAKKSSDEALAKATEQLASATAALQAAETALKEAEAKAKQVAEDAAKSPEEKKQAADELAAKHAAADQAKASQSQAESAQKGAEKPAATAAKNLARATGQKKAADAALTGAKKQIVMASATAEAAEKAAKEAEAFAAEKTQVAAQAAAKRKAAADTAAALAQARQGEQQVQAPATAAAQKLAEAQAQKRAADEALAKAKSQLAAATTAADAAEKVAQEAEAKAKQIGEDAGKSDDEKKQAADEAVAKRKAADDAKGAVAQAKQAEQPAQDQATTAAQKVAEAEAQKKSADENLAKAKGKVAAAENANKVAQDTAGELLQLDATNKQAAAQAAEKRKVANAAKAALDPKAKIQEQAAVKANSAAQALTRAEARKKSVEEGLANLKKRIASAKETHVADEKAAQEAEAAAVPLKAEAEKTRAVYLAARDVADSKRTQAEKAKTVLYRLVAARQVASLMESTVPPKPVNGVDEIVFAKLKSMGIQPVLCSDAVFIRRAYLDLTGKLPPAEEARAFIESTDENKRAALIDELLNETAHVDYWAMKWSDILRIKAEFPVKVWPNAAQAYYRWVWESISRNKPYDQFARELLTSSGSNYRVGAVNFYRAIQDKTPEGIASVVGLALMGTRIPFWPEERRTEMAAFFSQIGYKPTSEWKEEIVFWDPLHSAAIAGCTAPGLDAVAKGVTATNQIPQALPEPLSENGPMEAVFPDGTKTTIPANRDPREVFADWLIRPENPWFAKAIVNRTWAWAMGHGIIEEADDIRDDNPPSNPELLAYLQQEFVSSGYDLKQLKRLIFTSCTYQFSSVPRFKGEEANANFASYLMRRVEAEVLIDSLNEITGSSDLYTSAVPEPFTYIPANISAVELADGSVTSSFLTLFGRSARATGMESERVNELASRQWLHMLNSGEIQKKLQSGPKLVAIVSSGGNAQEMAEKLYLTVLSRFPTEADVKAAEEYAKSGVTKGRDVWIDLAWALVNSPEFLLRH